MAPQPDLKKIGKEGFDMIDQVYGRRNQASPPHQYHYQHHQSYTYRQQHSHFYQVVTMRDPVIDSNQAAILYGGTIIVDYSNRKPGRPQAF